MERISERIDVGGHELRVARSGAGPEHLLCLHGLVDSLEIWDRLEPELARRAQVIRLDQRAHGESAAPPGPYTREALAADVIGVLDALGIERACLLGHSMGGIIAMTAAIAFPDRVSGLVLIGTASRCNERTASWYERIALAGEEQGCQGLARAIYGEKARRSVVGDGLGIAHVTRTLKTLYADPLTPKLGSIRCSTLLLVGEKDPMGPKASQIIHDALPPGSATLEVLPGHGHWLHVEAPERVIEAFDRWRPGQRGAEG